MSWSIDRLRQTETTAVPIDDLAAHGTGLCLRQHAIGRITAAGPAMLQMCVVFASGKALGRP